MSVSELEIKSKLNAFASTKCVLLCKRTADETTASFNNLNFNMLTVTPEEIKKVEWPYRFKPLVCWGNTSASDVGVFWAGKTYNNVRKEDKYTQIRKLMSSGVSVVPAATNPQAALRLFQTTMVVKRKINHSMGRDVVLLSGDDATSRHSEEGYYFRPFIKFKNEYRFHVVNGKVLTAAHKNHVLDFDTEEQKLIRSYNNGWTFKTLGSNFIASWRWWEPASELSVAAVRALGYDFGAVDIGITEDVGSTKGSVYVIEINSAPGLIPEHAALYAEEFSK